MKKIFLLLFAAVCAVASWAQDVVTATFTSTKLDVALTNSTEFVAFQMDITLDAGINVENFVASGRLAEGDAVNINGVPCSTKFQLASNVISSDATTQTVRVIAYNLGNNIIQDASGTIFTADLDDKPTNVTFSNVRFVSKAQLEEIIVAVGNVEEGATFKPGDVTGDGEVDSADILAVIDVMLGNVLPTYVTDAADYDHMYKNEGKFESSHVLYVIECMLNK